MAYEYITLLLRDNLIMFSIVYQILPHANLGG